MTDTETCWADPLTRAERRTLSAKLAHACKLAGAEGAFIHRMGDGNRAAAIMSTSTEMAELHLDVTERAAVPPAEPMPPLMASLYATADLMDSAGKANR